MSGGSMVLMILVLGGLLGSGRRALARELSRYYGLYWYEIRQHQLRLPAVNRDKLFTSQLVIPREDAERQRVLTRATDELPLLSKMHPNVVTELAFHREQPRSFFLSEAAKHFSPVVFVWVESDEESALERIRIMGEQGEVENLNRVLALRELEKEETQLPDEGTLRFRFSGDVKVDARRLMRLVESRDASGARQKTQ